MKTIMLLLVLVSPLIYSQERVEGIFKVVIYAVDKIDEDAYVFKLINLSDKDQSCTIQVDNQIDPIVTFVAKNSVDPRMYVIEGLTTKFNYICTDPIIT